MHTVNGNGISDSRRYTRREARQIVAGMSDSQKQRTLDTIHVQQGVSALMSQQCDTPMLHYIQKLLTGGTQ